MAPARFTFALRYAMADASHFVALAPGTHQIAVETWNAVEVFDYDKIVPVMSATMPTGISGEQLSWHDHQIVATTQEAPSRNWIWDIEQNATRLEPRAPDPPTPPAPPWHGFFGWSPARDRVASCDESRTLHLWDGRTLGEIPVPPPTGTVCTDAFNTAAISSFFWSASGSRLATRGEDPLWVLGSGRETCTSGTAVSDVTSSQFPWAALSFPPRSVRTRQESPCAGTNRWRCRPRSRAPSQHCSCSRWTATCDRPTHRDRRHSLVGLHPTRVIGQRGVGAKRCASQLDDASRGSYSSMQAPDGRARGAFLSATTRRGSGHFGSMVGHGCSSPLRGGAEIWDAASGNTERVVDVTPRGIADEVRFAPDGRAIAVTLVSPAYNPRGPDTIAQRVVVLDLASGRPRWSAPVIGGQPVHLQWIDHGGASS